MELKHIKQFAAATAVSCSIAFASQASILLPPGQATTLPNNTLLGVVNAASTGPVAFNAPGHFSGTLQTDVWRNDPNNPWSGAGGLSFEYTLHNDSGSADQLGRLTLNGWNTGLPTRVDNLSGSVRPALYADNSNLDTVGFYWVGFPLGPGQVTRGSTVRVILQTPLTAWAPNIGNVIDGGTARVNILAPVPEPTTLIAGIGALGLLLFGARVHSKRSVRRIGK